MKVAIVEDIGSILDSMMSCAKEGGHETLAIHVDYSLCVTHGDCFANKVEEIVRLIRSFNPDIVFLDHNLPCVGSGQAIAEAIDYPLARLVGMSDIKQSYCGKRFACKEWMSHKDVREAFLRLIDSVGQCQ